MSVEVHWTRANEFVEQYRADELGCCGFVRERGRPPAQWHPIADLEQVQAEEVALCAAAPIRAGTTLLHSTPLLCVRSAELGWEAMARCAERALAEQDQLPPQTVLYLRLLRPRGASVWRRVLDNAIRCVGAGESKLLLMGLSALLDHSCVPTARLVFLGDSVSLRALTDLRAGDLITVSYIPFPLDDRTTRQHLLSRQFACGCAACVACAAHELPSHYAMQLDQPLDVLACWQCGAPHMYGLQRCARCQRAWYCSIGCQRTAFPQHKLLCRSIAARLVHSAS